MQYVSNIDREFWYKMNLTGSLRRVERSIPGYRALEENPNPLESDVRSAIARIKAQERYISRGVESTKISPVDERTAANALAMLQIYRNLLERKLPENV